MLFIRQRKHLARSLSISLERLETVLENPDQFYEELILINPSQPLRQRDVINVTGDMRSLQMRLYRKVLLPKLKPTVYSHGGVRGRSIKSNASEHIGSEYAFKADISNFYPSIHHKRVYRLFSETFQCSPDVARICTRCCTYRHHLALGLITSPFLADQLLRRVDRRIGGLCHKSGLVYTRFVDDVTISGAFDLEKSGIPRIVEEILAKDGFLANPDKYSFGRLAGEMSITGIRLKHGRLDVTRDYAEELERQLSDLASLVQGGDFNGPYYTQSQILGRVRYVSWINPGRRDRLIRTYRSIDWNQVRLKAQDRGLECIKKRLSKRDNGSKSGERGTDSLHTSN